MAAFEMSTLLYSIVGSPSDHLDESTVRALGNKPLYLVPLGIKSWYVLQLMHKLQIGVFEIWQRKY